MGQCKPDTCAQSASSASVGAESTQILRGPCLTSKTRRRSPRSPKIDDPCRVFKTSIHSRDGMNEIRGIFDRPYGHVPRSQTRGRWMAAHRLVEYIAWRARQDTFIKSCFSPDAKHSMRRGGSCKIKSRRRAGPLNGRLKTTFLLVVLICNSY